MLNADSNRIECLTLPLSSCNWHILVFLCFRLTNKFIHSFLFFLFFFSWPNFDRYVYKQTTCGRLHVTKMSRADVNFFTPADFLSTPGHQKTNRESIRSGLELISSAELRECVGYHYYYYYSCVRIVDWPKLVEVTDEAFHTFHCAHIKLSKLFLEWFA